MAFEIKENKGSIFKNDYKKEDKHPDYKGKINVEGKIYDIGLYLNETKEGKKYFGVSIQKEYIKEGATVEHTKEVIRERYKTQEEVTNEDLNEQEDILPF